jgi:hypothetical protein
MTPTLIYIYSNTTNFGLITLCKLLNKGNKLVKEKGYIKGNSKCVCIANKEGTKARLIDKEVNRLIRRDIV